MLCLHLLLLLLEARFFRNTVTLLLPGPGYVVVRPCYFLQLFVLLPVGVLVLLHARAAVSAVLLVYPVVAGVCYVQEAVVVLALVAAVAVGAPVVFQMKPAYVGIVGTESVQNPLYLRIALVLLIHLQAIGCRFTSGDTGVISELNKGIVLLKNPCGVLLCINFSVTVGLPSRSSACMAVSSSRIILSRLFSICCCIIRCFIALFVCPAVNCCRPRSCMFSIWVFQLSADSSA